MHYLLNIFNNPIKGTASVEEELDREIKDEEDRDRVSQDGTQTYLTVKHTL